VENPLLAVAGTCRRACPAVGFSDQGAGASLSAQRLPVCDVAPIFRFATTGCSFRFASVVSSGASARVVLLERSVNFGSRWKNRGAHLGVLCLLRQIRETKAKAARGFSARGSNPRATKRSRLLKQACFRRG